MLYYGLFFVITIQVITGGESNGKMIIIEVDPNSARGKRLKICEGILHTGAKFYEPIQLKKKVEDHGFEVLSINSTTLGYFLTAVKSVQK